MNFKFSIRMLLVGVLALSMVFLVACRSSRSATSTVSRPQLKLPSHWFEESQKQRSQLQWFTANISASYAMGEGGQSFQGQLRIQLDNEIWMNITKMGLEIFRLRITADSLFVWNRLERTLMVRDQSFVRDLTGMNVSLKILQDILMANYFLTEDPESLQTEAATGEIRFRYLPVQQALSYSFRLHPQYLRFEQLSLESKEGYRSHLTYGQFEAVEESGVFIPRKLEIRVVNPVDLLIRLDYQKVTLNQPQNMPFSVPESVKRI